MLVGSNLDVSPPKWSLNPLGYAIEAPNFIKQNITYSFKTGTILEAALTSFYRLATHL